MKRIRVGWKWRRFVQHARTPFLIALCVAAVFWKLVFTKQYTFLESPDHANQIMPWLDVQIHALRHFSVLLWDPYEAAGQSLLGQVQPGVFSPFTWLLALTPLSSSGHVQAFYVNLWFVFIHIAGAWFAYALFRDLRCTQEAAALGAVFYATGGYIGNIGWPQILAAAIWTPLVFLFLLRSLRGRMPLKSAVWAGVALGCSWLSGHHVPAVYLTLGAFGTGVYYLVARPGFRVAILQRLGIAAAAMCLVSAAQTLPAVEYGKQALRWTQLGILTWDERVPVPEHENLGIKPGDLLHILVPAGNSLIADPFVGCVALSLILLAILCIFENRYVRLFSMLGVCALFASMPRNNVLYGFLYSFVPVVERAREPIEALSLFHVISAALVALGASAIASPVQFATPQGRKVVKLLMWFGGVTLGLFYLHSFFSLPSPVVDGDPRVAIIAILGMLGAGVYQGIERGFVSRRQAVILLTLLLIIEQGNEVGFWSFIPKSDTKRATYLRPLAETQDLADFLNRQPNPKRIEWNEKDIPFSFGDWNRIPAMALAGASAPMRFHLLAPWTNRISELFGAGYTIGRVATRPNQREVFSDTAGYKVFANPGAFPRAWTVHVIKVAASENEATDLTARGALNLRTTAVLTGTGASLATCPSEDIIESIDERPQSASLSVLMGCKGLLVISDNWFSGWDATVDGKGTPILRVDSAIRGIPLEGGRHHVEMIYRPASVYAGLMLLVVGLGGAVYLQARKESDGADVMERMREVI